MGMGFVVAQLDCFDRNTRYMASRPLGDADPFGVFMVFIVVLCFLYKPKFSGITTPLYMVPTFRYDDTIQKVLIS